MKPVLLAAGLLFLSWPACVQPLPSILTPPNLPAGFEGIAYSQTLTAETYGTPLTWSLAAGALPAGVSLSPAGVISGVPMTAGTWIFGITGSFPGFLPLNKTFTLTILPGPPHLVITPATLPCGSPGSGYQQNLAAGSGSPPYIWSLTSGALPNGLFLSQGTTGATPTATALIGQGIAAGAVTSTFTITVTDSTSATASQTFTLAITPITVTTPSTLPAGYVGVPYSQTLAATGGASPYSWSPTLGALPPGLSLSSAGVISGTPTTAGTAAFVATVTDANSAAASQAFTLAINVLPLDISTVSPLPSGVAGTAYSQTLTATGGVPPYQWQLSSGVLPPLLSLSSAGVISGVAITPGFWTFNVGATDSASSITSQAFSLTITLGALTISTPATLPAGVVGASYSQTLAATGGVPPYAWQVKSGAWPPGLVFSSGGAITGGPSQWGSFSFTVQATDSSAASADQGLQFVGLRGRMRIELEFQRPGLGKDGGGAGTVTVTAPSGCQWTAASQLSWVAISAAPREPERRGKFSGSRKQRRGAFGFHRHSRISVHGGAIRRIGSRPLHHRLAAPRHLGRVLEGHHHTHQQRRRQRRAR